MDIGTILLIVGVVALIGVVISGLMESLPALIVSAGIMLVAFGTGIPLLANISVFDYREKLAARCLQEVDLRRAQPLDIKVAPDGLVFQCVKNGDTYTVSWIRLLGL